MRRSGVLLCLLLASCESVSPRQADDAPSRGQQPEGLRADLAFLRVNVIDVTGGAVLPDRPVLISGNRIAAVGTAAALAVPEGAQVIDARGKYLIPGLWDMHAHQLWSNDTVERLFFDFDPGAGSFAAGRPTMDPRSIFWSPRG